MNLFGVNRVKPTNIKGRALISYNGINEMQVAIWGEQEQEFERVEEIKEAIEVIKENYTGRSAPKIPTTPKIIELESVLREVEFEDKEELTIACGFNSESLDNILLPMKNYPLFTLVGESKTGKTNMMKNIIVTCERYWRENEFIIFDSNVGALNDVKKFSVIKKYAATKDEYVEILNYIMEEFENRRETVTKLLREGVKEKDILKNMKASIILIENITDVITNLDRREMEKLDLLAKNCKGLNMMIVACGTDSDFKTNMYTARFLKAMKESQVGIVFDSLNTQSFFGVRLKYNAKEEELKKGDGYLVINNKFYRIKTPKV